MGRRGAALSATAAGTLVLLGAAVAENRSETTDTIDRMKEFERSQGLPETGNFRRRSEKASAAYQCYVTGKLELPASYAELKVRRGTRAGCRVDERKFDVFFYPAQALATGHAPMTSSLANAPVERLLMVVPHEDLHQSRELGQLGPAVAEAAATLLGFGVAADFARERYGAASDTYRRLAREPELFLAKAAMINRYWEDLSRLYADAHAGRIRAGKALASKRQAFERLRTECAAADPQPATFKFCPAADNNAGLAFDRTYTRYYSLIYELFRLQGRDFRTTLGTLTEIGHRRHVTEAEAVRSVREKIEQLRQAGANRPA